VPEITDLIAQAINQRVTREHLQDCPAGELDIAALADEIESAISDRIADDPNDYRYFQP
jgi:hypothetical protein